MDNKTNYQKVVEFNEVFGVPVSKEPIPGIFDTDPKLVKLRMDLIREEVGELEESVNQKDMTETLEEESDTEEVDIVEEVVTEEKEVDSVQEEVYSEDKSIQEESKDELAKEALVEEFVSMDIVKELPLIYSKIVKGQRKLVEVDDDSSSEASNKVSNSSSETGFGITKF